MLISLHFDTCGQCDRTKVGLFENPEFVEWVNENALVVVGQIPHAVVVAPCQERRLLTQNRKYFLRGPLPAGADLPAA